MLGWASIAYRVDPKKYAHGSFLLVFVVVYYLSIVSINFMIISLAPRQSCDYPGASETTLKNVGK